MINIPVTGIHKKDKSILEINIYISNPYWVTEGDEAACDVKISPLDKVSTSIHGIDYFQALELAIKFSKILMTATSKKYDLTYHSKETHK